MQSKEKNYFKNNFIWILVFLFFLLSFPKIKSFFNSSNQNKDKNIPESFLYSINRSIISSTDFFYNIGDYFLSKKTLLNKISDLQTQLEIQKYHSVINSSDSLENLENNPLENIDISLKNKSLINKDLPVVAKKIFLDFTSIYDTILLDKGFSSGVEKGDIVFLYPNHIIGEVENINPNTSLVTLYSKNKNKIEGTLKVSKNNSSVILNKTLEDLQDSNIASSSSSSLILNKSHKEKKESSILIDIYGNGSGDFFATLPNNLDISIGTIIYLSSDENKALGEVVKVEKQEASFYETVLIRGYFNSRLNEDYYIMHK